MQHFYPAILLGCALMSAACSSTVSRGPLETVLKSDNPKIRHVVDNIEQHEVQIIYTRIERGPDGVVFEDFEYGVDDRKYFYPASTVKMPFALLALEKLGHDSRFDRKTPVHVEGEALVTTMEAEVRKVFAVSDNEAANRLFEYLGQDYIQSALKAKGLGAVRLSHRLSAPDSGNIATRPLVFEPPGGTAVTIPGTVNAPLVPLQLDRIKKGKGFYRDGELVQEPMDFSEKNYLPVHTLHHIMKRVIFPSAFTEQQQFQLSGSDREFVLESMSALPVEAGYDPIEYPDGHVKFLMFGDTKAKIPPNIRIFNKVGNAYGYLTDCAYIKDETNGVEFMVTATIHVNENQIFNDDEYEYDQLGLPFLAELGRQIYQLELERK